MTRPNLPTPRVDALLRRYDRLQRRTRAATAAAWAAATLITLAMAALLLDAAVWLSPLGLAAADAAALGPTAVLLGVAAWRWRGRRADRTVTAGALERRLKMRGDPLVHAVELSREDATGSPALRAEAVYRGEAAAGEHDMWAAVRGAVDRRPLRRAMWIGGGTLAVAATVLVMMQSLRPGTLRASAARLAEPWALHPPPSPLIFEVAADPLPVPLGESATLRVLVDAAWGEAPASAAAVLLDDDRREVGTVAMRRVQRHVDHPDPPPDAASRSTAFELRLPPTSGPTRLYIAAPGGRSGVVRLPVDDSPRVTAAWASVRPPAYLTPVVEVVNRERAGAGTSDAPSPHLVTPQHRRGAPPEPRPLPLQGATLRATAGGEATITLRTVTPLDRRTTATFESDAEGNRSLPVTITPGDPRTARIRLPVERDGRLVVQSAREGGREGGRGGEAAPPWTLAVEAVADRPPRVRIVQPAIQAVAVEGWSVPMVIEAEDDHGVMEFSLDRKRVGTGDGANHPIGDVVLRANRGKAAATLDLAALNIRAGDVLRLTATARDAQPGGVGVARSTTHTLRVISREQYDALMRTRRTAAEVAAQWDTVRAELARLRAQREALLERLRALEDDDTHGPMSDPRRVAAADAAGATAAYAEAADDLARRLEQAASEAGESPLYEFEPPWAEMLGQRAADLRRQAAMARELARVLQSTGSGVNDPAAMTRALRRLMGEASPWDDASRAELERAIRDLERLRQADASGGAAGSTATFDDDPPLSLDPAAIRRALQQMAQSRRPAAATMATAVGTGGQGRVQVLGPRQPSPFGPASGSGDAEGTERGTAAAAAVRDDPRLATPHHINTEADPTTITPPTLALPGVPAAYQDEAAAYFRRLAEDSP